MIPLLDKCLCGDRIFHSKCLNAHFDVVVAELEYQKAKEKLNEKKAALLDVILELGGSTTRAPS